MKNRARKLLVLSVLLCLLTGCTKQSGTKTAMDNWAETARLDADETAENLYNAALEEDVLKIYTVSSRLFDVAESFQKQYPGLLAEVTYYRTEEIKEKLEANAAAESFDCDLIFITNGDGSLTEEMIPKQLAYQYVPKDIKDKLRTGGSEEYLSILLEVPLLAYNEDYYNEAPIKNWWELTEPEWKGKLYITDPAKSMISYTMFAMFMKDSEGMAEAYREYFGRDFVSDTGESAGKAFVRMLIENDIRVANDSDDVANAIAAPGSTSDSVGIINASKLRLRDQGYALQVCYETEPFAGVINPADIMIAGGAKNINSAKLFIRWILGEADGEGEGYKPFLQEGAWPSRTDVVGGASKSLEEMNVIYTDEEYTTKQREGFLEFWSKYFIP